MATELQTRSSVGRAEVYRRASRTLRVSTEVNGEQGVTTGVDCGIAVRLQTGGTIRFAAVGGDGTSTLRSAWRQAVESPALDSEVGFSQPQTEQRDHDTVAIPPSLDRLRDWLSESSASLTRACGKDGPRLVEAWLDTAATTEEWLLDGRSVGSRVRLRAWAMARLVDPRRERVLAPLFVASRRWDRLPVRGWAGLFEERQAFESAPRDTAAATPLLFAPEASAAIVLGVSRVLHGGRGPGGETAVGPGWCLRDDPHHETALYGGIFDDVCLKTETTLLSDGSRVIAGLQGPGHYRRPSFRDPPQVWPSHLRVAAGTASPPAQVRRAATVQLHVVGREWVLEIPGGSGAGGSDWIRTDAGSLALRCVAAVGPARASHRGVETPALLFEGLEKP